MIKKSVILYISNIIWWCYATIYCTNSARGTITDNTNNILKEGELRAETSVGISDISSGGRKPKIYNLDMIIVAGYRVNSKNEQILFINREKHFSW